VIRIPVVRRQNIFVAVRYTHAHTRRATVTGVRRSKKGPAFITVIGGENGLPFYRLLQFSHLPFSRSFRRPVNVYVTHRNVRCRRSRHFVREVTTVLGTDRPREIRHSAKTVGCDYKRTCRPTGGGLCLQMRNASRYHGKTKAEKMTKYGSIEDNN